MYSDTSQIESEILEAFVKGRRTNSNSKSTNWLSLSANKDSEPKSKDPLYIINQFNLFKRFVLLICLKLKAEISKPIDTQLLHQARILLLNCQQWVNLKIKSCLI